MEWSKLFGPNSFSSELFQTPKSSRNGVQVPIKFRPLNGETRNYYDVTYLNYCPRIVEKVSKY